MKIMKIIGYSERGAMNALFYGMALKNDLVAMRELLELAQIPDAHDYSDFKLYMEFSLSEFGDPDLVFTAIRKGDEKKTVFFVEAKVSDCSTYKINKAFDTYSENINNKEKFIDGETSNLFFQLRLKNRFFTTINDIPPCNKPIKRDEYQTRTLSDKIATTNVKGYYMHRSIGNNPVVRKFVDEIKECQSALYIAILPEKDEIKEIKEEHKKVYDEIIQELKTIHIVSWHDIFENPALNKYVKSTFIFNEGPDPLTDSGKLKSQILNAPISVEIIAKQFENQGLSLDELIKKGNLGLTKATKMFEENKHQSFTEYATWWIRQSIMQALAENTRKTQG